MYVRDFGTAPRISYCVGQASSGQLLETPSVDPLRLIEAEIPLFRACQAIYSCAQSVKIPMQKKYIKFQKIFYEKIFISSVQMRLGIQNWYTSKFCEVYFPKVSQFSYWYCTNINNHNQGFTNFSHVWTIQFSILRCKSLWITKGQRSFFLWNMKLFDIF